MLAARSFTIVPLVLILPKPTRTEPCADGADPAAGEACPAAASPAIPDHTVPHRQHARSSQLVEFDLGGHRVAVSRPFQEDCQAASQCWQCSIGDMDLHEPFQRIQEAIQEAQKASC